MELLSSAEGRGVAGGYGCDGGALRWLLVVLQIERGRELERAERRDRGRGGRGRSNGALERSGVAGTRRSRRWRPATRALPRLVLLARG